MNPAAHYAKALYELVQAHPEEAKNYLKNLRAALKRRGHDKLLPRIWSEFQKLDVQKKRAARHRETTPHMQRTDALLQLYRRLIATK